ncbi:MAG: pilus assembly protein [Alphaproteobacteria bacterium]|nr:pilus assembly protein [Alphaproteobacteria bacterium]
MKRLFQCERGIAAIEFAMIVPLLTLILIGVVDYGMFINQKMKLQDLARTATQYVVQGGSDANVMADVIQTSDFYNAATAQGQVITVTTAAQCECANGASVSCTGTCTGIGNYVRHFYSATLSSTYRPIFIYPGISSSLNITGYSRMQYSQ